MWIIPWQILDQHYQGGFKMRTDFYLAHKRGLKLGMAKASINLSIGLSSLTQYF